MTDVSMGFTVKETFEEVRDLHRCRSKVCSTAFLHVGRNRLARCYRQMSLPTSSCFLPTTTSHICFHSSHCRLISRQNLLHLVFPSNVNNWTDQKDCIGVEAIQYAEQPSELRLKTHARLLSISADESRSVRGRVLHSHRIEFFKLSSTPPARRPAQRTRERPSRLCDAHK